MPEPVLQSSSPTTNEVNVNLNVQMILTWDVALSAVTASPAIIYLENSETDEVVDSDVQYTAGGLAVTVVPDRQLQPNTAYILRITGTDTSTSLGALEAVDTTELSSTISIPFQTGTEISTSGLEKTFEEETAEGDLELPDQVTVSPTNTFYVCSTNPENKAWDVPRSLDEIRIAFSSLIDDDLVNENTVTVEVFPFLEDPKHFAVPSYQGASEDPDYLPQFEWQAPQTDANGTELNWIPPTGTLSVSSTEVIWSKETGVDFPYNSCIEVTLDRTLGDTGANTLGVDQQFTFYTDPWPEWVSPRRIRRALHPINLAEYPDDVLGLAAWNASIQVGDLVQWALDDLILPPRLVRDLVEAKTIADIFRMLMAEKQLAAGEYKRLGDMEHEIRFPTSRAADAKPEKLRAADEEIAKLEARVRNYWIGTPRTFVKGLLGAHERPNYRTRLWRQVGKTLSYDTRPVVENLPAGNTAAERWPSSPGQNDQWS